MIVSSYAGLGKRGWKGIINMGPRRCCRLVLNPSFCVVNRSLPKAKRHLSLGVRNPLDDPPSIAHFPHSHLDLPPP